MIPNTYSKTVGHYYPKGFPEFAEKSEGAYLYDEKGNAYIDYVMGLGPVILGHSDNGVKLAASQQMEKGVIYSLPSRNEELLMQEICEFTDQEACRLTVTGSEACSAAVKIARAVTGRSRIISFGYHGWHDWAQVEKHPASRRSEKIDIEYNDKNGLVNAAKKKDVAAIILEPIVLESPREGFLRLVRKTAKEIGALVIYDEVVTALRMPGGTAAKYFGEFPDLLVLGKALGNGFPISCVVGRKELIHACIDRCFVSGTYAGWQVSVAVAREVLKRIGREEIDQLWRYGENLKSAYRDYSSGMNTECIGLPFRTHFTFPTKDHRSIFQLVSLKNGVFFGHSNFISLAHGTQEMELTYSAMREGLRISRKYWSDPCSYSP